MKKNKQQIADLLKKAFDMGRNGAFEAEFDDWVRRLLTFKKKAGIRNFKKEVNWDNVADDTKGDKFK